MDLVAAELLERLPDAVSIVGPDGVRLHTNTAGMAILADLPERREWNAVDTDGTPLPHDQLPVEITRLTGRECSDVEIGLPDAGGAVRWLRISTRRLDDVPPPCTVIGSFADVTEERHTREELQRATELFATAFAEAPIGMALVGLDGSFMKVNAEACRIVGYSEAALLELTFQDITHPDDLDADLALLQETLDGKRRSYQMHKRYLRSDGRLIWALLSVSLVLDEHGEPLHFISHIDDDTERRELELRLQRMAERDDLTGLANRRRFDEALSHQLARCARSGERAALAMIDLDGFKQLNDSLGHAAGDGVLRSVATGLSGRLRSTDTVARVGGDEFAVLLVDAGDDNDVGAWLAAAAMAGTAGTGVTASVGVTDLRPADTAAAALARADAAMYETKRARRGEAG